MKGNNYFRVTIQLIRKSFATEKFEVFVELGYHHFTRHYEIIELSNDHQWLLKRLGEKIIGNLQSG